jgi:hypothetical protein
VTRFTVIRNTPINKLTLEHPFSVLSYFYFYAATDSLRAHDLLLGLGRNRIHNIIYTSDVSHGVQTKTAKQ